MILTVISFHRKKGKMRDGDKTPRKYLEAGFLNQRKMPFLILRGHCKKDTFILLLKRAGIRTPRILLFVRLIATRDFKIFRQKRKDTKPSSICKFYAAPVPKVFMTDLICPCEKLTKIAPPRKDLNFL